VAHDVGIGVSEAKGLGPGVSAKEPPTLTPHDVPIEGANNYVRTALLNDPDVVAHLRDLAVLRAAAAHRSRSGSPGLVGHLRDGFEPAPGLAIWSRYWRALEASPLLKRGVFSAGQLDQLVAVVRERVDAGLWGKLIPVNDQGAGLGRQKARKADRRSIDALELALAAVVREINPAREPRALAEAHPGTVRTNLHRLRKLATL
jgi:hypothetical protein